MELDKRKLKRLAKMAYKLWSLLTEDEKISYHMYDVGKVAFIKDVAKILHYKDLTDEVILYVLQNII